MLRFQTIKNISSVENESLIKLKRSSQMCDRVIISWWPYCMRIIVKSLRYGT